MHGSEVPREGVVVVEGCDLRVRPGRWAYAEQHGDDIDAHWQRRRAESPMLFNGVIHLLTRCVIVGGRLGADFVRTDFKSFLLWRETGHPEAGVRDCFGSALILSRDGQVLLGRQRAGQVNSGLLYPPSGFIDPADIGGDGVIDIAANVAREVGEETGLDPAALTWDEGFLVAFSGAQVAIARTARSKRDACSLREQVLAYLAGEEKPELVDVRMVRSLADAGGDMPAYARVLLGSFLTPV